MSGISGITSQSTAATSGSSKSSLSSVDFMKVLSAKMSMQDPLSPMDSGEMLSELSSLTSLSSQESMTNLLSSLVSSLTSSSSLSSLGKTAMVEGQDFVSNGGETKMGSTSLTDTTIRISDSSGKTVFEGVSSSGKWLDVSLPAGTYSVKTDSGAPLVPVKIEGMAQNGNPILATGEEISWDSVAATFAL